MEEKHQNRVITVNPQGQLCIDNQLVDSDMILFEEEAKILLENELMEGPQNVLSDDEDDFSEDGYYDKNNYDEFDASC